MNYRNRRRRRERGFFYRLRRKWRYFTKRVAEALHHFGMTIRRLLPPRKPGQPIWKSSRFIAAAAGGVLCVAIVLMIVLIPGGEKGKSREEDTVPVSSELAATPEPTAALFDYYMGCADDAKIMELQERLVEIGYMETEEITENFNALTEMAVKRFELLNGVAEPTGHVNNELWDKIFSDNYAEFVLQEGMEGEDIKELQDRLRDLGYLTASPTGYYGTDTEAALRTFQEKHGLEISGKIDDLTSDKLYSEDVISLFYKKGDKSDEIKTLQARLKELGYITFEPDGEYGNGTYAAVKQFQVKNDLVADGYLGYETQRILLSGDAKKNILSKGDEGDAVTKLQKKLVKLGYINKPTGYYGSDTVTAVKNFQKLNGLSVDGMAGAQTLTKLSSGDAKKATTKVIVGKSSKVNQILEAAKSKLGSKYVLGAKGPSKFDCSGLVYWSIKQVDPSLAKHFYTSAGYQYKYCKEKGCIVSAKEARKGDLVFWQKPNCHCGRKYNEIHHVGFYLGNGMILDASSSNRKVLTRRIFSSANYKVYAYARPY